MDTGTIAGVVSAGLALLTVATGVGRWSIRWARRRKKERAAEGRLLSRGKTGKETAERRAQRTRRAAAIRQTNRRSNGGWVFKGTGISPRGWLDRWR
jgi:hypothetical protein